MGTGLDRLHDPLMGFSHPHARAARQVPPAQPTVTASTDQELLDRMPADCIHRPHQSLQGGHAPPAATIPHAAFPPVLPLTPAAQFRSTGTPADPAHPPLP